MAVTLKDIAGMVGVSINTASRALQDKPDIGIATRKRVKDAAEALGYRPNLNARSLVLKKSSTIGIAVTEPDNLVRMAFCEQLRSVAAAHNYRLLTSGLSHIWDGRNLESLSDLLARGVDGLVIGYVSGFLGEMPVGKILLECRAAKVPVICFGNPETMLADCVKIDFYDAGYRLTQHFLQKGYRDVAFLTPYDDDPRIQGYRQAMAEARLEDRICLIHSPDGQMSTVYDTMCRYLQTHPKPPRGLIAVNDMNAIVAMSALKHFSYSIPQDCAVAGFDNIEVGNFLTPSLTSIGLNQNDFAANIWNLMAKRLKNETDDFPVNLELKQILTVRESS